MCGLLRIKHPIAIGRVVVVARPEKPVEKCWWLESQGFMVPSISTGSSVNWSSSTCHSLKSLVCQSGLHSCHDDGNANPSFPPHLTNCLDHRFREPWGVYLPPSTAKKSSVARLQLDLRNQRVALWRSCQVRPIEPALRVDHEVDIACRARDEHRMISRNKKSKER
ncbi:hypothetical protein BJY01DRAFT_205378 [Aspergillus pseudoustus]|uniref:Uncharacterized protein n=1 Tax=Aspergillus pseudoustus TaxID=1810923 RepID=A0ABR4KSZ2_9EURO